MLIVLVGAVPNYRIEKGSDLTSEDDLIKHVTFTEDISSIVTEVGTVICLKFDTQSKPFGFDL